MSQTITTPKKRRRAGAIRMPVGYDRWIMASVLILAIFGLIMVTSASMGLAVGDNTYLAKTVAKQLIFSVLGYVGMLFFAKAFNFDILRKNINLLVILTYVALGATLLFSASGGARAWIRFSIAGTEVTIQPSEFAKISIILILAAYLCDLKVRVKRDWDLIKAPIIICLSYIIIVAIFQSDFGSSVVMFLIMWFCCFIPQHPQFKRYHFWMIVLTVVGIAAILLILSPLGEAIVSWLPLATYQKNRILSAINPFVDQYNTGYQLINGLVSFASGGLFGVGFGNSVRKYTNFPAANTDFILAILVEELGFLGFLLLFALYMIIIIRLFKYAFMMKSEKGRIVLVGTAMYIFVHFLFNVGGVTGLIPLTGVPLLMISAGGSSTMSLMVCIGISQAVIAQFNQGALE